MNAPQPKSSTHRKERTAAESGLLLYPQNPVLCRLGDSEFDDSLGWNLDLLLRLGIEAGASLPLLLYQLAETGQDEFTVLFNLSVCERAESLKEYACGLFIGLRGFGKCALKFCLGHVLAVAYGSGIASLQENRSGQLPSSSSIDSSDHRSGVKRLDVAVTRRGAARPLAAKDVIPMFP